MLRHPKKFSAVRAYENLQTTRILLLKIAPREPRINTFIIYHTIIKVNIQKLPLRSVRIPKALPAPVFPPNVSRPQAFGYFFLRKNFFKKFDTPSLSIGSVFSMRPTMCLMHIAGFDVGLMTIKGFCRITEACTTGSSYTKPM